MDICVDTDQFPLVAGMHIYKGIRYQYDSTPDLLSNIDRMNIQTGDWMVATYAKSGTTWMQEILYLIATRGDTREADRTPLHVRVPFMEIESGEALLQTLQHPRIIKTHLTTEVLPSKVWDKNVKIIAVIRNPKDVAVSFYHFYRANRCLGNFTGSWEEFFKMYVTGNVVFGSWFTWIKSWFSRCWNNENVFFLSYEKLKANPQNMIKDISNFLGIKLADDIIAKIAERTSFSAMKANRNTNYEVINDIINPEISPFMRKGEVGDWKNYFTESQNAMFRSIFNREITEDNRKRLEILEIDTQTV